MHHLIQNLTSPKIENAIYVVATPIGNLHDITLRAIQILSSVDYIICEDTRISSILLSKFEIIKRKLLIYNDYSDDLTRNKILNKLQEGHSLALISDAGTPLISDPGYKLINFLRNHQQKIITIPGPSSLTSALSISGIACDNFLFLGFLPNSPKQKNDLMMTLPENYSLVFFEVANRLIVTLEIIQKILKNRKICIARELTKIHEEVIFGNVDEVIEILNNHPEKIRGEMVVIVEKAHKDHHKFSPQDLIAQIQELLKEGKSVKDIVQELTLIFDYNKKEIYKIALELAKQSN